jgi:hypothetical protein
MRGLRPLRELMRRWKKFARLPAADRRALVAFALALSVIDVSLRTVGWKRTERLLAARSRRVEQRDCTDADHADAEKLARLIAVAGRRGIYRTSCLRQALLLQSQLRRRGLPASLRLGARTSPGGDLDAHAWVELGGRSVGGLRQGHRAFRRN